MKKILCSSQALANLLEKFIILLPEYRKDETFKICSKKRRLLIEDLGIDIEAKSEWELEFTFNKIKQIKRLVKKIPHQPLTIVFSENEIEIVTILV